MKGWKVVDPLEMARIEKMAYAQGESAEEAMIQAGRCVARHALKMIEQHQAVPQVFLMIGKGNNGGDAYAAGSELLAKGLRVQGVAIYPNGECSPLNRLQQERFVKAGGTLVFAKKESEWMLPSHGIVLDGLVGSGFRGRAEDNLAHAITKANQSSLPILAIDIPSGLNGADGNVETVAISADRTVALELPKMGFFLREGWNHTGELFIESVGLASHYIDQAQARAFLPSDFACSKLLPAIKRNRHKYQAGYVLAVAGSRDMPGAAFLATSAALRSGAGIVRLFHCYEMYGEMSGAPLELVRESWDLKNFHRLHEESHRAGSILVGPGLGREKRIRSMLKTLFKEFHLPFVIDADALYFLAGNPDWIIPVRSVLTPHHAEMRRLLGHAKSALPDEEMIMQCQEYVETHSITLVLKGAPTFIFHPGQMPLVMIHGNPGMATAGSGDVLTGIIAAMLAQKMQPLDAAVLSVFLHGISGERAAKVRTSYGVVASELITHLSDAFHFAIQNK